MKKIIICLVAVVLVAGAVMVGVRLSKRGTDLIGVTSLEKKNTVIMNAKSGSDFTAGSGILNIGQGEGIHLEYALETGSFDLALAKSSVGLEAIRDSDLENLPDQGEVYGKSGVSGKGELDFPADPGEYTLYFNMHGAVGSAQATAK